MLDASGGIGVYGQAAPFKIRGIAQIGSYQQQSGLVNNTQVAHVCHTLYMFQSSNKNLQIQKRLLTDLDLNNISNYNILTPSDEPGLTASAASPGR